MSACTVEKAPQGPPGQPQIRLELPGEIKSLEDLHLKAPLPRRPKQQYQHNYHHRRRGSSHDAAAIRSKASPDFESDHRRRPSLSAAEAFFLRSLLIDDAQVSPNAAAGQSDLNQKKELSDSILFSIPPSLNEHQPACCEAKSKVPPKPKRPSNKGLWQAHAAGIPPRQLVRQQALTRKLSSSLPGRNGENSPHGTPHLSRAQSGPEFPAVSSLDDNVPLVPDGTPFGGATAQSEGPNNLVSPAVGSSRRHHRLYGRAASDTSATLEALAQSSSIDYDDFCPSDQEVRPRKDKEDDDSSDDSSWGNDNHLKQFNAWEILEDEYAGDFGFETHTSPGSFMILGTSAVDTAAHPHVMSPPLMDALMHHLPPNIRGDNYWLRFSLVRDGANLETLKHYVRSSQFTILAIETDQGQVFGSFTSTPWRNNFGYFGGPPSFVWKMRRSRQTRCASLFEQAELESQVDVFPYVGQSKMVQVCRHDLLAVGGDDDKDDNFAFRQALVMREAMSAANPMGFAIALEDDLLRGTTSPCASFHSPALCGDGDKSHVFHTSGLEVWTFTPCRDVETAERMEMTKFFIEESSRSSMASTRSSSLSPMGSPRPGSSVPTGSAKWAQDRAQEEFFRRVGHDPDSEERRQRWQYQNMMDGSTGNSNRGMSSTPRFGYS